MELNNSVVLRSIMKHKFVLIILQLICFHVIKRRALCYKFCYNDVVS